MTPNRSSDGSSSSGSSNSSNSSEAEEVVDTSTTLSSSTCNEILVLRIDQIDIVPSFILQMKAWMIECQCAGRLLTRASSHVYLLLIQGTVDALQGFQIKYQDTPVLENKAGLLVIDHFYDVVGQTAVTVSPFKAGFVATTLLNDAGLKGLFKQWTIPVSWIDALPPRSHRYTVWNIAAKEKRKEKRIRDAKSRDQRKASKRQQMAQAVATAVAEEALVTQPQTVAKKEHEAVKETIPK